jgi:hypothetical protein
MNQQQEKNAWFPTYGMLTYQRILERFNIVLPQEELIRASQDTRSPYHQLLRVPLKNIFNGIILQQAQDYQVYAQKLFIDYLLTLEDNPDPNAQGAIVREDLEAQRLLLLNLITLFREQDEIHQIIIAESQALLIDLSQDLPHFLRMAEADPQFINNLMADCILRADADNINLRQLRRDFYDVILRTTSLLQYLPDYQTNLEKQLMNRSSLSFDAMIGE